MSDTDEYHAQLVMKREDGSSILDADKGLTAETANQFDVSEERAARIRRRLEELGFKVTSGNLNTLSISGPSALFAENFGLEVAAPEAGVSAHATKVRPELADEVSDVFVTPAPEIFR